MKEFKSIEERNIYIYAINNGNNIHKMYTLCCMTFNNDDAEKINRLCKRLQFPAISKFEQGKDGTPFTRFTIRHISQGKYNAFMVELKKMVGEDHITLEEGSIFAEPGKEEA